MLKFITDIRNPKEPDILPDVKNGRLLIVSLDHQLLGSYEPPQEGWSHDKLNELSQTFPEEWSLCGADAIINDQWIGSTEV